MSEVVTPSMPDAIRRIADSGDRQLAWQFFVFFSRFEYALKRCPHYLLKRSAAEPNWDRFSSDHDAEFQRYSSPAVAAAIEYFKNSPPQKQEQIDGQLAWSEPRRFDERGPLLVWLLIAVRGVRNNLFHGGKFPGLRVSDPSRDRDLISNAVVILDACLKLDLEVERYFFDGIDEYFRLDQKWGRSRNSSGLDGGSHVRGCQTNDRCILRPTAVVGAKKFQRSPVWGSSGHRHCLVTTLQTWNDNVPYYAQ